MLYRYIYIMSLTNECFHYYLASKANLKSVQRFTHDHLEQVRDSQVFGPKLPISQVIDIIRILAFSNHRALGTDEKLIQPT